MTTRTYGLLGVLVMLMLVLAFTANAQEGTPTIIELRTPNQIATSVGGVVLPKPQLDVLRGEDPDLGPSWDQIRFSRLDKLANTLLERIHFDFDSSVVDDEGRAHAAQLADLLRVNQDVGLFMSCHTDLMGSDEYNQALSERRANSVSAVLQELGVPALRLKTGAFGEQYPEVREQRKERLNRRCQGQLFLTYRPVEF